MISIEGLTVEFGGKALFDGISYVINKKDRIALVGKNGAGKSTMLKIIAGLQEPTRGNCVVPRDVSIGYLPQHMIHNDDKTVFEEAEKAFEYILSLQKKIEKKNVELCERTDYESEEYHTIIEEITNLNEHLSMLGGGNFTAEIEKTLFGLGFVREDFTRKTSEFSGGWRMRIELAKLLLRRPDVLLLDEPTNHLDVYYQHYLMEKLKEYSENNFTVVAIMHNPTLAFQHADHFCYLHDGCIHTPNNPEEANINLLEKVYNMSFIEFVRDNKKFMLPFGEIG